MKKSFLLIKLFKHLVNQLSKQGESKSKDWNKKASTLFRLTLMAAALPTTARDMRTKAYMKRSGERKKNTGSTYLVN